MRGGSAIYCPLCKHRQTVGEPGDHLELPMKVVCEQCGAELKLEPNLSGGVHVTAEGAAAK
ncbi:MAG: hypothetical protein PVJ02_18920 [Gemmatimonadota bacterium]